MTTTAPLHIRHRVALAAILIFVLNLTGYVLFRHAISPGLFGSDLYNISIREKGAFAIKKHHIKNPQAFYQRIDAGRNGDPNHDPDAFLFHLLPPYGKQALTQLKTDPDDRQAQGLSLTAINQAAVDGVVDWPEHMLQDQPLPGPLLEEARFHTRIDYLFLDPLKHLTPRNFISSPAYMDWETDFTIRAGSRPFQRTVEGSFTLYRLDRSAMAQSLAREALTPDLTVGGGCIEWWRLSQLSSPTSLRRQAGNRMG